LKKWIFLLLVLLVLFSGCLNSESNDSEPGKMTLKGLKFYTILEPAFAEAKVQDKPLFVYFRSETCGWCKKFEAETFTNQSVIETLNENFILVSIDVYKQKNETRGFGVFGTPTSVFLYPNRTEMLRIRGYTDNQTFLNTIRDPMKPRI